MVLAVDPPALLADDPAASLDIRHRIDVVRSLVRRETERLCVIVMHGLDLAFRCFERPGMLCSHSTLCNLGREAAPMNSMRRDDVIWTVAVTLIALTINPILKSVGLLPADVFRGLGIFFPGQPQIVFAPLMAFLLLALFLKTGKAMVFPVIGFLRALSLSFVYPANVEHSGTLLAAIVAGGAAVLLLNNPQWARSSLWLSLLAGLYAGLYAAFNYLSTVVFGPTAQTAVIVGAPLRTIGVVVGSFVLGTLLGFLACRLMRPLQANVFMAPSPRYAA